MQILEAYNWHGTTSNKIPEIYDNSHLFMSIHGKVLHISCIYLGLSPNIVAHINYVFSVRSVFPDVVAFSTTRRNTTCKISDFVLPMPPRDCQGWSRTGHGPTLSNLYTSYSSTFTGRIGPTLTILTTVLFLPSPS